MELRINVEAGLFLKIIKRGGGKTYLINVEGVPTIFKCGGGDSLEST